jgi:N-methylhydantoinase B
MAGVDVITYEVLRARLDGIVREMEVAVMRTGFSTIVRESRDFSCCLTDHEGQVVGQGGHPSHMGAYPESVRGLLQFFSLDDMADGDAFLINHPYYSGCPHANDMVVLTPVMDEGRVVAFASSMGHTPDIGGVAAGSRNATARDLFGEGLQLFPMRFMREHCLLQDAASIVRANSRVPDMMIGDLSAKAGVCFSIGVARLQETMDVYSVPVVLETFEALGDRAEELARSKIEKWQDGAYEAEAWVDDPSDPDHPVRLHVAAIKEGDRLVMDFTGTGDQVAAPINVRPPLLIGMALNGLIAMTDPHMPNNHGLMRAVECRFRPGSLINPVFPGPVGFYSKTVAIVESVIMSALSKASGRPALAHGSTQSSIVVGSAGEGSRQYVQYELLMSGSGAYEGGDGYTGTNHGFSGSAKYTSIEIIESEFAVEMEEFALIPDTGGAGAFRGGLGFSRQYRVLSEARLSGGAAKRESQGAGGGEHGSNAYVIVHPGTDREQRYPGIVSNVGLRPGDVYRIETAGGGGVNPPRQRDPERVAEDMLDGYITTEAAREVYGMDGRIGR